MKTERVKHLRPYQDELSSRAKEILEAYGFVYLAMGVRTGKTLTSIAACDKIGAKNVLFITKKKAMSSVQSDYNDYVPGFRLVLINFESVHKIDPSIEFDVIVVDESHKLGAFPKPSGTSKNIAAVYNKHKCKIILMSGTPTPESFSQMYHQVNFIKGNPFENYTNFYKFAKDFVDVKQKKIGGMMINEYDRGKDEIIKLMELYTINYTQERAGFKSKITEWIEEVPMEDHLIEIINKLKRDLVIEFDDDVILADTAVKLQSKIHQLCSGTIKYENGKTEVISTSKAIHIKDEFPGSKLAIFYKFTAELDALKIVFGDSLTTSIEEFNETNKHIALQVVSGREGTNLSKADYLIYYNIDFSATSYWQSRDRMTTIDRPENHVIWLFSKGGIEDKIYKAVTKKKNYTLRHFKKDYL